jgi:chromosome segregation ATPase
MSRGDFIQQFEASMAKLTQAKQNIQAGVEMRQQFTENLKSSLSRINQRLAELVSVIANLKRTTDQLQLTVNNNTNSIGEKERQIQELRQQVAQSQQERDAAIASATEEKRQLQSQIQLNQQKIDECENRLRQLEANLQTITDQKNALDAELRQKGDLSTTHANEINRLTQESQQLSQQQQQEFQQQQQALTAKIAECENKIQEFEQRMREKDAEILRANQDHESTRNNSTTSSQNLQNQITQLTSDNENLVRRIIEATQAINEASDTLNAISNGVPNATTQTEVNDLLQQIERSLENIGRAIQGQPQQASSGQQNSQPRPMDPNVEIELTDNNGNISNVRLGTILQMLSEKAAVGGSQGQKYQDALNEIRNSPPINVNYILHAKNIEYKNNKIMGGRKSRKNRKNRKQKGGFTYKTTYKRKSISSIPKHSSKI